MVKPNRILIVDDSASIRSKVRNVLADDGYIFEEASNGLEGLQKVSTFEPDLILLDVVMPKMDGLKMWQTLQKSRHTRHIPIIILTSHDKSSDSIRSLRIGANDFLTKPFEDDDLLTRVQRQLEVKKKLDWLMSEKEDLHLIQQMIHSLYEKNSMYDLLYTMVEKISEVIDVERCSFVRVRDDRKTGVVEASSDGPRIRNLEIDLKKYPEILEVLQTKEMLIIQDIGKAEIMAPAREYLKDIRLQSLMLIPVVDEKHIVGTLLLRTARCKSEFLDREIRFLEAIAEAARPAILNAKLFEAVEERLLTAPAKGDGPADCKLCYDVSQQDQNNPDQIMDQAFRLKGDIQRLKDLRKEAEKNKRSSLPEKDSE
jgi:CheY-like chemotaxis protein